MTRLARNAPAARPTEHGFALHVRWRVGARGLLTLVVRNAASTSAEVTLSADAATPSVRRWTMSLVPPASPIAPGSRASARSDVGHFAGSVHNGNEDRQHGTDRSRGAGVEHGELNYALRSSDGSVSAQVTIVHTADAGALLLTDLPERLGLMGGTYVVESLQTA
jgi:hypothetical protein